MSVVEVRSCSAEKGARLPWLRTQLGEQGGRAVMPGQWPFGRAQAWKHLSTRRVPPSPAMLLARSPWLSFLISSTLVLSTAAYEVPVSDKDYDRQICSGMWADQKTYINGASHARASLGLRPK